MYDIADKESKVGKNRASKVFKICKKYFSHHQKSVFKGETTPSKLIKFKNEIQKTIDKELDFVTIIKLQSQTVFEEDTIGNSDNEESIFI
jgi:CRISPR-associated protein Cas2